MDMRYLTLLLALWLLSGCQPDIPPAPTATAAPPTAVAPATTLTPTATLVPSPTPQPATLLPIPWDDRSLFTAGLTAAEQPILQEMTGAAVYQLDLTLAGNLSTLSGREAVRYTNQENEPLTELYLRLYPNLTDGSSEITTLQRDGQGVDATYEFDNSALAIPLDPPLQPHETTTFTLEFEVQIPQIEGGNYGTFIYDQGILALAHFYPFIPVYDDEGWNVEIPSPQGDVIYGDSSFYLVQINAPADLTIAGSGVVVQQSSANGRQTLLFAAGPMRDFYLIASERFEKISTTVGETTINHYGFSDTAAKNQAALDYAAATLRILNEQIGPYPFTELDLAASPTRALGVEYPGLVINNASLYTQPDGGRLQTTTVHEVGHQWFYSTVGNDQLDEPWLDESLTQFATLLYFEQAASPPEANSYLESLQNWAGYAIANDVALGQPVAAYEQPEFAYGATIYGRGPLFFVVLREQIGPEAFSTFLHTYYATHKFGIATTESLRATAEQSCNCDLQALFEEWVYE